MIKCVYNYIYISSLSLNIPWSLLISNMDYLPRLWFQQCLLSDWLWLSLPHFLSTTLLGAWMTIPSVRKHRRPAAQNSMKEERAGSRWAPKLQSTCTYSLPWAPADLLTGVSPQGPHTSYAPLASSTSPGPALPGPHSWFGLVWFIPSNRHILTGPSTSLNISQASPAPILYAPENLSLAVCWLRTGGHCATVGSLLT